MSAATGAMGGAQARQGNAVRFLRDNAWTIGLLVLLGVLLAFTKALQPSYGPSGIQGLAVAMLPLALAAVGQTIVVVAGGIDLSLGSIMALTSVVAATLMKSYPELS